MVEHGKNEGVLLKWIRAELILNNHYTNLFWALYAEDKRNDTEGRFYDELIESVTYIPHDNFLFGDFSRETGEKIISNQHLGTAGSMKLVVLMLLE